MSTFTAQPYLEGTDLKTEGRQGRSTEGRERTFLNKTQSNKYKMKVRTFTASFRKNKIPHMI
jgi:hypothetical protein